MCGERSRALVADRRAAETIETVVLVCGGGTAGLATAVTAAKQGLRVILVERYGFCGGGAVAGLSGTVCGLYQASACFIMEKFLKQPGVIDLKSNFVLERVKDTTALPLAHLL